MKTMDVRIEQLPPMRIATVRETSLNPESDAWSKLKAWAEQKGLLRDLERHAVYGYTSEQPKKGQGAYSYEFWIRVDAATEVGGDLKEAEFAGGLYAVTTHDGPPTPDIWKELWDWVQTSPYQWRKTHELEHPRNPLAPEQELIFDLYLPVEPKN